MKIRLNGRPHEVAPGTTGFAHFFEHLMFHGTEALPAEAREDRLLELAAEENAWTSEDDTCYHLLFPAQQLEAVLRLEVDRFSALVLTDEGVRRESGAVYGEFRKSRSNPEMLLWEALWSTAFAVHPYGHSTLGLEADIAAMPDAQLPWGAPALRPIAFTRPSPTTLLLYFMKPRTISAIDRPWYGSSSSAPSGTDARRVSPSTATPFASSWSRSTEPA